MFPMVIWTKPQKVIRGVYLCYCGTTWKVRNILTVSDICMFIITAYVARLFYISFHKNESCMFRNATPKGLPVLPPGNQGFFGPSWEHVASKTFTRHTFFAFWRFATSAIRASVDRRKYSFPYPFFIIKRCCTRPIAKLFSASICYLFNYWDRFATILAMIWRCIVQGFGTFKTNFIGGCTTESSCFYCQHNGSFGVVYWIIALIAGDVNEINNER